MRCVDAGAEIVRITVQGKKEAQACGEIREALFKARYDVPLVADIHFQPQVAMMVADAFEKIRINPGNFADGRKTFDEINYDDPAQYDAEKEAIREVFQPLVDKCKALGRAIRIGTNHGRDGGRGGRGGGGGRAPRAPRPPPPTPPPPHPPPRAPGEPLARHLPRTHPPPQAPSRPAPCPCLATPPAAWSSRRSSLPTFAARPTTTTFSFP